MNDIDLLMHRVEEINFKNADDLTAKDIDDLITYHRYNRSRLASGEKPKKPTQNVDVKAIMEAAKARNSAASAGPSKAITLQPAAAGKTPKYVPKTAATAVTPTTAAVTMITAPDGTKRRRI